MAPSTARTLVDVVLLATARCVSGVLVIVVAVAPSVVVVLVAVAVAELLPDVGIEVVVLPTTVKSPSADAKSTTG